MFFGLTNAPAIFLIYINKFLVELIDEFCVVYFDDIFIYSKTRMEYIRHVKKILKLFKDFNLHVVMGWTNMVVGLVWWLA